MEKIILIIMAVLLCSCSPEDSSEDSKKEVVMSPDGEYACKWGRAISISMFETPEEAMDYCDRWEQAYKEARAREDWKVVK